MSRLKELCWFALYGIVAGALAVVVGIRLRIAFGLAWSVLVPVLLAGVLFGMWPLVRRSARRNGRPAVFWQWAVAVVAVCGVLLAEGRLLN